MSYVWLYANESDVTASTVDGYRIRFGDSSGDDEIVLERIDDGSATAVITSSGAVSNGLTDIGFLVRVTRNSSSSWTLYTSSLPTSNGSGDMATAVPSSTNASTSQGTATDNNYTSFSNGYFGFVAKHSSGATPRAGAEFDQYYFDTSSDASLPVELIRWTAKAEKGHIILEWATASEIENLGYLIYKGLAGNPLSQWQDYRINPLLQGQGSTTATTLYLIKDNQILPNQIYAYSLSDVDYHGQETRHDTIVVKSFPNKILKVMSNPLNPKTRLELFLDGNHQVSLDVFDLLGRWSSSIIKVPLPSGKHIVPFNSKTLPSGLYFLVLKLDGQIAVTEKITLLK